MSDSTEKIEFFAHKGECSCGGVVKMPRTQPAFELNPKGCFCISCGKEYFVDVGNDIDKWESEQWDQKGSEL